MSRFVACPVCATDVSIHDINAHLDAGCADPTTAALGSSPAAGSQTSPASQSSRPSGTGASGEGVARSLAYTAPGSKRLRNSAVVLDSGSSDDDEGLGRDDSTLAAPAAKRARGLGRKDRSEGGPAAPLAERVRPERLEDMRGQEKALAPGTLLATLIEQGKIPNLILWGPPGCGKTTLAHVIRTRVEGKMVFRKLSAVSANLKAVREELERARNTRRLTGKGTVLFLDEIHRFNKMQQDVFLPALESGLITLIGATTENPAFEINDALLSRTRIITFEKLSAEHVIAILRRALDAAPHGSGLAVTDDVLGTIAGLADGDARAALNALELAMDIEARGPSPGDALSLRAVKEAFQTRMVAFDRAGDEHYNVISALHKSLRGSDVDASLYWLGRQLAGGEKVEYIARRLIRFAAEDVGMADPQALAIAVSAFQASHLIGMPEADVVLAQAVVYLAKAPKSVAVYEAIKRVKETVARAPNDPVPIHLRNAPRKVLKDLGHGAGYVYPPHATRAEAASQSYLPDSLRGTMFFMPDPTPE